jgi:hypothetical protein
MCNLLVKEGYDYRKRTWLFSNKLSVFTLPKQPQNRPISLLHFLFAIGILYGHGQSLNVLKLLAS